MSSAAMARGTSGTNPTRGTWSSSPSARSKPPPPHGRGDIGNDPPQGHLVFQPFGADQLADPLLPPSLPDEEEVRADAILGQQRGRVHGHLVTLHHAKPAHQPHQQPVARDPEIAAQWTAIETGVERFGVDATGEGDDPLRREESRAGGLAPGP